VHMDVSDVASQLFVRVSRRGIKNKEKYVETRQKSSGKVDVLDGRDARVVAAVQGVGGSEDGCAGIESGGDTSLADGDGLLLHDFVNGGSIAVIHLVKLIDTAHAVVGEHKSTTFEDHLVSDRVTHNSGGQTDTTATATGCVDTSGRYLGDVLQELRFGHTRVTHQADVDVTTDPHTVLDLFGDTTNQLQQKRLLNVDVTEDLRGNRARQIFVQLTGPFILLRVG
jgi:hypothetical protein